MELVPQLLCFQMALYRLQILTIAETLDAGLALRIKRAERSELLIKICSSYTAYIRTLHKRTMVVAVFVVVVAVSSGVSRSSSDAPPVPVVLPGGVVACDTRDAGVFVLALEAGLPSESLHCSTSTSTSGSSVSVVGGSVADSRSIENEEGPGV